MTRRPSLFLFPLIYLAVASGVASLRASIPEDAASANSALSAGNASSALSTYQLLLDSLQFAKSGSPELWYDRGLAEEKMGDSIASSLSFRRALLLDPTLVPARKALTRVLASLGTSPVAPLVPGWRDQLLAKIHPEAMIVGGALVGWLGILFLVFAIMRVPRRASFIAVALIAIILGHGFCVVGSFIDPRRLAASEAVITAKSAPALRATPADSAESSGTLPSGSLITILSRNGMWWYVADGSGQTGWILSTTATPLLPSSVGS